MGRITLSIAVLALITSISGCATQYARDYEYRYSGLSIGFGFGSHYGYGHYRHNPFGWYDPFYCWP